MLYILLAQHIRYCKSHMNLIDMYEGTLSEKKQKI